MRMRLLSVFVLLFIVAASVLAQNKAPNFKAAAADGSTIELSQLKGKVVVINYWATWCAPCRKEIPGFIDVYSRYKPKGLEIIGVSVDDNGWAVVKPYIAKSNINYPIVLPDEALQTKYGDIGSIPTTFFVDRKGNVVERHVGYMDKSTFENKIKALL